MSPDRWLTVRQAAELLCQSSPPEEKAPSRSTLYRRLRFLDERAGGKLLKRFSRRGYRVSAEALLRELRTDPEFREAELSGFHSGIADLEKKLLALREAHRALKARVKTLESVPRARCAK